MSLFSKKHVDTQHAEQVGWQAYDQNIPVDVALARARLEMHYAGIDPWELSTAAGKVFKGYSDARKDHEQSCKQLKWK